MARQTAGRQRKSSGSRGGSRRGGARKQSAAGRNSGGRSSESRRSGNGRNNDAIALLKADHREVEGWFSEFEKTSSEARKADLARRICEALKAHTTIEEEIFYPAFLEATGEEDIHHEAEIEHDGAKKLIAEIESAGPDDDHFDARVSVLSEMIKHHVNEEEQRGGMFAKARKSDMDLKALGEELKSRKAEVMGSVEFGSGAPGEASRDADWRGSTSRAGRMSRGGARGNGREGRRAQAAQQR